MAQPKEYEITRNRLLEKGGLTVDGILYSLHDELPEYRETCMDCVDYCLAKVIAVNNETKTVTLMANWHTRENVPLDQILRMKLKN